ncbi:MAG: DnaJ domain-containing protein [Paracoccaceae bacterium]
MPPRSPFDFDISVSADKARRARQRGMSGAVEGSSRECEWPGCESHAAYRAPVSPDQLNEFRWFCLDHVRAYNKSWNFFDGWSEEELDAQVRADRTWERPTWSLKEGARAQKDSPHSEGKAWARWGFKDPMDVLGDAATQNPGNKSNEEMRPKRFRRLSLEEARAMDILGMPHETESLGEVRTRYRELVKDLHPDMNEGARGDEARLARVIRAWDILKKSRSFRE